MNLVNCSSTSKKCNWSKGTYGLGNVVNAQHLWTDNLNDSFADYEITATFPPPKLEQP